uniref:helix-turn-helix domain-containing protein n=1 Tax=Pedobacter schmidteae TaxID=2201271 RepID=UPI0013CE7765|nr:helix-turn-helix domain-containing protein [Pedobacter schmidteae]
MFFSRFGQLLVLLLVNSKHHNLFPFFHQLFTPFYYASSACFFLYITSLVNGRERLEKNEWLHFVPLGLAIIHVVLWPFVPPINWNVIALDLTHNKQLFISERSGLFPAYFYYLGRPALVLGYLVATWYVVVKSGIFRERKASAGGKKWVLFFLKVGTFFQLISFLPMMSDGLDNPVISSSIFALSCMVLLVIMIFVLHNPGVLYGYLFVAVDWNSPADRSENIRVIPTPEPSVAAPAVKRINLLPDQLSAYAESMKSFMEEKKTYLEPDFQIVDLALALNVPVHHCSFVLNNLIGKNFRDWINGYRIRYFIGQYPLKSEKMIIEAIARESGFKSQRTFYNAFKKETGLMPKVYFSGEKRSDFLKTIATIE